MDGCIQRRHESESLNGSGAYARDAVSIDLVVVDDIIQKTEPFLDNATVLLDLTFCHQADQLLHRLLAVLDASAGPQLGVVELYVRIRWG